MNKFLSILVSFITCTLSAQPILFQTTVGGPNQDIGRSVVQTTDKGYVGTGSTSSYGVGNSDVWLVKTWPNGNPKWSRTFGGPSVDWGTCLRQTRDTGLIIAGYTNSFGVGKGYDCYLIKTDSLGNLKWSKTYGGNNWDFAYGVSQTSDGGYILVGGTYSYGAGDEDVYLIKTNSLGDTLWTRRYGGARQDEGRSVKQTFDGGYIIAGVTKSFGDLNGDVYIIKTNSVGDTLWTRRAGGAFPDDAHDIIQCTDSTYMFIGATSTFSSGTNTDFYIGRFSKTGTLLWTNNLGGAAYDRGESLVQVSPSRFAVLGSTKSYGYALGSLDMLIYFVNSGGFWLGGNSFGDGTKGSDEEGFSIARTTDNGFILFGYATGFNTNGIPDFYFVKTDSIARNVPFVTGIVSLTAMKSSVVGIFPNPADDYATIRFNEELTSGNIQINLLDASGRNLNGCLTTTINRSNGNTELNLNFNRQTLLPGLYFYEVTDGERRCVGKLILR